MHWAVTLESGQEIVIFKDGFRRNGIDRGIRDPRIFPKLKDYVTNAIGLGCMHSVLQPKMRVF
jgi:hypothetical protein